MVKVVRMVFESSSNSLNERTKVNFLGSYRGVPDNPGFFRDAISSRGMNHTDKGGIRFLTSCDALLLLVTYCNTVLLKRCTEVTIKKSIVQADMLRAVR